MTQWFMIIGEESGDRSLHKVRVDSREEARNVADQLLGGAPYRLIDSERLQELATYSQGFQYLFKLASEIRAEDYQVQPTAGDDERQAA